MANVPMIMGTRPLPDESHESQKRVARGGSTMGETFGKPRCYTLAAWALWLAPLLLTGCSTAGSLLGISLPRHPMIESAKTLRVSGTGVQPLPRELDKQ